MQIIEPSGLTPEIIIDSENSFIAIRGVCVPEDGAQVFNPVMNCVEEIIFRKKRIHIMVEFEYFNSVSSHYLLKIFSKISSLLDKEQAHIEWKYEEDDEDNLTKAECLEELSGLEFKFVVI